MPRNVSFIRCRRNLSVQPGVEVDTNAPSHKHAPAAERAGERLCFAWPVHSFVTATTWGAWLKIELQNTTDTSAREDPDVSSLTDYFDLVTCARAFLRSDALFCGRAVREGSSSIPVVFQW